MEAFYEPYPVTWDLDEGIFTLSTTVEAEEKYSHTFIDEDNNELEGINLDGLYEYGYGFWFRYLTEYPVLLLHKPAWL